jgi:hypothetical protein
VKCVVLESAASCGRQGAALAGNVFPLSSLFRSRELSEAVTHLVTHPAFHTQFTPAARLQWLLPLRWRWRATAAAARTALAATAARATAAAFRETQPVELLAQPPLCDDLQRGDAEEGRTQQT